MSLRPYLSLAVTSTRSAGAIGWACFTAMTCRACRGPTTHSKATSVRQGAACCGSQAKRALHSARCNAKARGNSSRAPQQRPSYSRPWGKPRLRIWHKKDSALLRIANGSACRADPCVRLKYNSINCVRPGRHYSLQAQGDFRGIARRVLIGKLFVQGQPEPERFQVGNIIGRQHLPLNPTLTPTGTF